MPVYSGIGVYSAYAEDDAIEGDEVSSTYEGRHLTFLGSDLIGPNALIQKGDPVVVASGAGDIVGVAFKTQVLASDKIAIDTEGIWMLEVTATNDFGNSAVVAGNPLYIDTTDLSCVISKIQDPESNTLFGYALGNIDAGETAVIAVKVHWGPSLDNIWMGILNNYSTAVTGVPRIKVDSDTALTAAGNIHIGMEMTVTCTAANTLSSFYGGRYRAVIGADSEVGGSAHPTGMHGYAVINGTVNGADVTVSGIKGEIYSPWTATITEARFLCGVLGLAALNDEVVAGQYSAFIAYSHVTGATPRPDSMFYAWGYYNDGIDMTGWANTGGSVLRVNTSYGCDGVAHGTTEAGRLLVDRDGNQRYLHLFED